MADISTFEEGVAAARLGVDLVATTLSGYAKHSQKQDGPDIELIRELANVIDVPVVAEGRISNADEVRAALEVGAYAVVVGSMITRPHLITKSFAAGTRARPAPEPVISLDIGGTKMAGGIVDASGQLLVKEQIPTPADSGGIAIVNQAVTLLETIFEKAGDSSPGAIGISTGGQVDELGELIGGTDMLPCWVGMPLKETIAGRFKLPTAVLNDGHAAALAESHYGAGRNQKSMLCIVIGTGLGGGLAIDGRIQHGAHGLAGSVGQIKVSPDDRSLVPLEALVSGPGLLAIYNDRVSSQQAASNGQEVAQRARAGDEAAMAAIREMGRWLGLGLSHALHVYDTSCVVVGGSVAQIGEPLLDSARQSLRQYGHATVANTPILPAELGPEAQLVGAAVFAWQSPDLRQ
jgi:predicted NBD/HSP70 family sugar kinase